MSFSMPRARLFILSAFLCALGALEAGEAEYQVPANAQVTRLTRFNLRYSLRDVVADGVQKVEFYITDDMGATWRLYGEDPDRTSPMTIEVPGEGIYGFVSVATDRFGNREREPGPRTRPETYVIVDRTPPAAKWLSPLQNVLGRGRPVELKWEASDKHFGPQPVRLQFSTDARNNHDRDAVWNTLQENLPATGTLNWTPPSDASAKYNFRLIAEDRAGNLAVAYNPATVVVDSTPPIITGVSPLRSNQLRNNIVVEADDPSGSGVKEISLYTTDNSGSTWTLVKELGAAGDSRPVKRVPGQPIVFEAQRAGDYGLWPVVFDEAGNASALPTIGVVGPYVLVIDNEPPTVTLSNSFLSGRTVILANDSRTVEWNAYDPHIRSNSAAIFLSLDNGSTWQEIQGGLPTTGFTTINFPFGSFSEEAKLKVTVEDDFGNTGESVSDTFKLSRSGTDIEGIGPSGSTPSMPQTPLFEDVYGGDTGVPPTIPMPGQSTPPSTTGPLIMPPSSPYPSSPYPSSPYPDPQPFPTTPDFQGGVIEPIPPATPRPPLGGPVVGQDESTAGSLPQAMLSDVQSPSAIQTAPPATPFPTPPAAQPAPSAPASPSVGWTPSTSTGSTPPSASTPLWQTGTSTPPSLPVPPPVDQGTTSSSPWGEQTTPVAPPIASPSTPLFPTTTPPAPPSTPSAPATPSSPAATEPSSPFGGFGDGGIAPPPLPPADSTEMPALPSAGSSGLSLDDWGELPPLAGADAAPSLPAAPSTPPSSPTPSTPSVPSTPPAPPPSTGMRPPETSSPLAPPPSSGTPLPSTPAIPSTPAVPPPASSPTPVPSPLGGPPADVPQIPRFEDDLTPPPFEAPSAARPSNPRQLSNHYADEAKNYLEQGRSDLALDSATKSLNADEANPMAYSALAQAYVQQEPPNFARAATLAKEATNLGRDWYSWWTCADVFYRWAHARNLVVQAQFAAGQRPPADLLDERNQALSNAQIAIGNSAMLAQNGADADREKVAITQGEIIYLRALTIPEPVRPPEGSPAAAQYRQEYASYKATVAPILQESLPYFQTAMSLGGAPTYREAFRMGIVNFRLGGLERETGNTQQATTYYDAAARLLEEAINASQIPPEGPREAYYMLAYCHDQLAEQPGSSRARHKEAALRYWRQTAVFYPDGTAYRDYADQRIQALADDLGR